LIVAIPTDDGVTVSEHFGRSKNFLLVKVENGRLAEKRLAENPHNKESDDQTGHGKLLKMLTDNRVNKVICFNLNPRMESNLGSLRITVEKSKLNSTIDEVLRAEVNKKV
jgi:predicted Fe-Mo cluster-binding NifX family protein